MTHAIVSSYCMWYPNPDPLPYDILEISKLDYIRPLCKAHEPHRLIL